jgi:hypothetical protein
MCHVFQGENFSSPLTPQRKQTKEDKAKQTNKQKTATTTY